MSTRMFSGASTSASGRRVAPCRRLVARTASLKDSFSQYTNWEDVEFNPEIEMTHDVKVVISKPRQKVFDAWKRRAYLKHFPLLESHKAHNGKDTEHEHVFWYQYPDRPALEIHWTSARQQIREGESISFVTEDGAPVMGEVRFSDVQGGQTEVHLHVQYILPSVLGKFVGPLGVKTDVNRKLHKMITEFGNDV